MRPRLADYVLSMPRGAQIMYPKDIAQVIQAWRHSFRHETCWNPGADPAHERQPAGRGGERGRTDTIEMRSEFARVAEANATVYFGGRPHGGI